MVTISSYGVCDLISVTPDTIVCYAPMTNKNTSPTMTITHDEDTQTKKTSSVSYKSSKTSSATNLTP